MSTRPTLITREQPLQSPPDVHGSDSVSARYRRALAEADPGGTLSTLSLTPFDRTGVPVAATVWDAGIPTGGDSHGVGYGATWRDAEIGALGELAERVLMRPTVVAAPRLRASYAELRNRVGERQVIDPVTLVLEAGSDYRPDRPLDWVVTTRWRTGERVWVPVEFVASDGASLGTSPPPGGWLTTAITNGLGAGDTVERAVGHALLELVQRDGDTVSFRALDRGTVIDLSATDDRLIDELVRDLRAVGIAAVVKLASTEFANVVYCVGHDSDPAADPMALSAIGEAAHPDRTVAIRKALLEYASSRARRSFAFGPTDRVALLAPHYWEQESRRPVEAQEPRALAEMARWTAWDAATMRAVLAAMFVERDRVPFQSLPSTTVDGPAASLTLMLKRLADFDVLVHLAGPFAGMWAAKVIAPGLEVESLSYGRVGERVAARLLEQGSDLVGRGPADRDRGRLQLHLTAQASERLGGPLFFDAAAWRRTLGQLYPLYREPRRHAVQRLHTARQPGRHDSHRTAPRLR